MKETMKKPMICTPLVGETEEALRDEIQSIRAKKPDVIEWRADFFQEIANTDKVIGVLRSLDKEKEDIALLFTIRSEAEGGEQISLSDKEAIELMIQVTQSGLIDFIDCELRNDPDDFAKVQTAAQKNNVKVIGSYHNFQLTPGPSTMLQKVKEAKKRKADIAKIAVMPADKEDVLLLLQTSHTAESLEMPLITISMGPYGAVTRFFGHLFGSVMTFGIGRDSSAPGQVPVDDIKTVLGILDKTT